MNRDFPPHGNIKYIGHKWLCYIASLYAMHYVTILLKKACYFWGNDLKWYLLPSNFRDKTGDKTCKVIIVE